MNDLIQGENWRVVDKGVVRHLRITTDEQSQQAVSVTLSPDECRALRDTIALRISFLEAHRRTFKDYELQTVFESQMNDLERLNRRIGDALWEFRKKGMDATQKAEEIEVRNRRISEALIEDHDYANPCKCCGEKS